MIKILHLIFTLLYVRFIYQLHRAIKIRSVHSGRIRLIAGVYVYIIDRDKAGF